MQPIKTEKSNTLLLPPEGSKDIESLPIQKININDEVSVMESCWELSEEDLEQITKTKRIYVGLIGQAHPPIYVATKELGGEEE